jgi:hypothetical protein
MKKTAVLLAGLLLVTGTVFAEGWSITDANVEGSFYIVDTQNGMNMTNGDVDLEVESSKDLGDGKSAFIELNFDENTESDIDFGFEVTEGDFFASIGAQLALTDADSDGDNSDAAALELKTKDGDSTYLGWYVMGNQDMKLTVYPYEIADMSWDNDTWESFTEINDGGFALAMTLAEDTTATFKWAVKDNTTSANVNAFKGELSTKVSGISLDAYLGLVPEVDEDTTKQDGITAMGVYATMTMDALTLKGEFNTSTTGDADAAVGLFAKAALALDEMNGYATTAYASFKNLNEQALVADGNSSYGETYTEIEAGVELSQGSFTVKPKIVMGTADAKAFSVDNDTDKEKAFTKIGVTFGYDM